MSGPAVSQRFLIRQLITHYVATPLQTRATTKQSALAPAGVARGRVRRNDLASDAVAPLPPAVASARHDRTDTSRSGPPAAWRRPLVRAEERPSRTIEGSCRRVHESRTSCLIRCVEWLEHRRGLRAPGPTPAISSVVEEPSLREDLPVADVEAELLEGHHATLHRPDALEARGTRSAAFVPDDPDAPTAQWLELGSDRHRRLLERALDAHRWGSELATPRHAGMLPRALNTSQRRVSAPTRSSRRRRRTRCGTARSPSCSPA